jgi:hypothetical protein
VYKGDLRRLCASPNNVIKTVKIRAVRVRLVRNIQLIFGGAREVTAPGRPK